MKFKALFVAMGFSLITSVSAESNHFYFDAKKPTTVAMPYYCEIEIDNNSFNDVVIYGVTQDGRTMPPTRLNHFSPPYYIYLGFSNGFCPNNQGMMLYIDTVSGYPVSEAYYPVGSIITLTSQFNNSIKAITSKR